MNIYKVVIKEKVKKELIKLPSHIVIKLYEWIEAVGISRQNLCDIERNRRFVSPKVAAQFAENLGYSKNQFVRLCLQDLLNREGLSLSVDIHSDAIRDIVIRTDCTTALRKSL